MEDKHVDMFLTEYLKTNDKVSAVDLQKFIKERPEVGKALPIEQLEGVLTSAWLDGRLEVIFSNDVKTVYKASSLAR